MKTGFSEAELTPRLRELSGTAAEPHAWLALLYQVGSTRWSWYYSLLRALDANPGGQTEGSDLGAPRDTEPLMLVKGTAERTHISFGVTAMRARTRSRG